MANEQADKNVSDNLQGQPDLENHQCVVCGVTQTPLRDHNHDHYLCNACRLYQRMNGGQLNLLIVSDSEQEDKPKELFAVTPLKTCPHLEQIKDSKVPSEGLNTGASCKKCSKTGENWVCLKCFEVYCSRYVEGHALGHTEETKHPLALSFADFSVWCYPCNNYIDNEVFEEAKKAAIKSKFGEDEIKNV